GMASVLRRFIEAFRRTGARRLALASASAIVGVGEGGEARVRAARPLADHGLVGGLWKRKRARAGERAEHRRRDHRAALSGDLLHVEGDGAARGEVER